MPLNSTATLARDYDTNRAIYDAVGQAHTDLSKKERRMVISQLESAMAKYEHEAIQVFNVRLYNYTHYNRKIGNKRVVSLMSRDFNMSIRGHNDKLEARVKALMTGACEAEIRSRPEVAVMYLKDVRLSYDILLSPEVFKILKKDAAKDAHAQIALDQIHWIKQYRETLFQSVVKLATYLGKKGYGGLTGDVIAEADLIQEAILGAREAVMRFQPQADGKTFTSFVHNWVSGIVSKYINENTRTVSIPRSTIDRYRSVQEAIEQLGTVEPAKIAIKATKILHDKRQQTRGSKLRKKEIFTPEEVTKLMLAVQDTASLDAEIHASGESAPVILSDRLVSDELPADQQMDKVAASRLLMSMLREHSSPDEYMLMELRWGMGKVLGLKQTADLYRERTGRPMNKGKVALIEKSLFGRLKRSIDTGDKRLLELKDVIEELF